jgi:hypothetical protein
VSLCFCLVPAFRCCMLVKTSVLCLENEGRFIHVPHSPVARSMRLMTRTTLSSSL